jgi:glycosyltransferase involved in cell wall biosynthesis
MRICHITTVHEADDARIFHRMCRGLADRGCSVVVVAPAEPVSDRFVRTSSWNARIKRAGRLGRIVLALRAALDERADVYHFHDPELISIGLALKTIRPSSAVVYDVHEDYPAMMMEKHWLPRRSRSLVALAVRAAQRTAGRCLDGIVTADPGVEADFQSVAGRRTFVYYNFPVLSLFAPSPEGRSLPQADLVYVGGMSERAGTFVLLDALVELAGRGFRPLVKLAGYADGDAGWHALRQGIQDRRLTTQVELRGKIPHSEVPGWIRSGRIGLVTLQPIAKFMKNIPSKMFEYWACGLPVIGSDLPPVRRFLADGETGVLFTPSSPKDLARAIQCFLERPEQIAAMGCLGQRLVQEKWNNDQQVDGLIRFYDQLRGRQTA